MRAHIRAAQADLLDTLPGERLSDQSVLLFRLGLLLLVVACGTFCATGSQTFTVIGLRLDFECTELLIAAVLPDPVADQIELLSTSEDDFTPWAEEFHAPDPDTAAALAHEHCRTSRDED
ncbi:hypothetical protein [Streptomyces sp. NPDC056255]|uniref:hypothetical protein n=1 Tax=Streptomyces sp. NPDC056255 TaxID=3345764 RepID=UPI0035E3A2AC